MDSAWSTTDDLNEEGAALMDEKDAQEALALLDHNKRTFKDARDRQHQVRSSNNLSPILGQNARSPSKNRFEDLREEQIGEEGLLTKGGKLQVKLVEIAAYHSDPALDKALVF